ncbi:Ras family [Pelomyxa schiedti]|nr:Ras family [Pelomyxa schiedti]
MSLVQGFQLLADEILSRQNYCASFKLVIDSYVNSARLLRQFEVGKDFVIQDCSTHQCGHQFRFILLGDPKVGKKEFIQRFARQSFDPTLIPEYVCRSVWCNRECVRLQVRNECQTKYDPHQRKVYRASVVMICFDLTERSSFDNLIHWFDDVLLFTDTTVEVVLVGMKADLPSRAATNREIADLCTEMRAHIDDEIFYFETSSLTGHNVDLVFKVATCLALQVATTQHQMMRHTTLNHHHNPRKDCLVC